MATCNRCGQAIYHMCPEPKRDRPVDALAVSTLEAAYPGLYELVVKEAQPSVYLQYSDYEKRVAPDGAEIVTLYFEDPDADESWDYFNVTVRVVSGAYDVIDVTSLY